MRFEDDGNPVRPLLFDLSASRLLRDNGEVHLRPQACQVPRVLLLHQARALGYDQMIAEAWQGMFVSRHTVDVTVGEVKKSLGEYGPWIVHRPKVQVVRATRTRRSSIR